MKHLFELNGLAFWDAEELRIRKFLESQVAASVEKILRTENKMWAFFQIEAPLLTPRSLINNNYTNQDIWVQEEDDIVLRPETTPSSYVYIDYLLSSNQVMPPFVIWQTGKSFRREQNQVHKNMRLKEFYQQEFQCVYSKDTLNDYHEKVLEPLRKTVEDLLNLPTRIVDSDRLPSYSLKTSDIEVDNGDKWMEVASISKRTDLTSKAIIKGNPKDLTVLELAFGLDRLVYNYFEKRK
jgi:glycyl-tRNA synthetase